jgi:hypothetical protein
MHRFKYIALGIFISFSIGIFANIDFDYDLKKFILKTVERNCEIINGYIEC